MHKYYGFFVRDCLFTHSFREESKSEQKDDNYDKLSRRLRELH